MSGVAASDPIQPTGGAGQRPPEPPPPRRRKRRAPEPKPEPEDEPGADDEAPEGEEQAPRRGTRVDVRV